MKNLKVDERIKVLLRGSYQLFDDETACNKLGITLDDKKQLLREFHDQRRECLVEAIKILHEAGMTVETLSELFKISEEVIKLALEDEQLE